MLRQKITDELNRHEKPMTLRQLEAALGVPRTMLRTALIDEFYTQIEFDHPEHGRVTAWKIKPAPLMVVDGDGRYSIPTPPVEPEPELLKAEEGVTYVDKTKADRFLLVTEVGATRIVGQVRDGGDEVQAYGTDAATFHAIWQADERPIRFGE